MIIGLLGYSAPQPWSLSFFFLHMHVCLIHWLIRLICFWLVHLFHLLHYKIIIRWLQIIIVIIIIVDIGVIIFIFNVIGIFFTESSVLGYGSWSTTVMLKWTTVISAPVWTLLLYLPWSFNNSYWSSERDCWVMRSMTSLVIGSRVHMNW